MGCNLITVMYHYVRDKARSKYPRIKGLDIAGFARQLDIFQNRFNIITAQQIFDYFARSVPLPENACWLTFDDGYSDHYDFVFPELVSRGLQGSFFPPVCAIVERDLLDVNKIHHILASVDDVQLLVSELSDLFNSHELERITGKSFDLFRNELCHPSRFDPGEIVFVKRLMQHALPGTCRGLLVDTLFKSHVSADLKGFADELYVSVDQLKEMIGAGMYVGSHGYRHLWLDKETYDVQASEVNRSLDFLRVIGAPTNQWVMCYPYGAYNNDTLEIVKKTNCTVGITTRPAIANLAECGSLELPRLDTNDFPQ